MDGEFGTYHATHIATNALLIVGHADNVIALAVGLVGLIKQVFRAELNTETASLAPFCVDNDPILVGLGYAFAQGSPVMVGVC